MILYNADVLGHNFGVHKNIDGAPNKCTLKFTLESVRIEIDQNHPYGLSEVIILHNSHDKLTTN